LHYYPAEPFLDELVGKDSLEFPQPQGAALSEDDAVIPSHVIEELFDAPDEIAMASLSEVWHSSCVRRRGSGLEQHGVCAVSK